MTFKDPEQKRQYIREWKRQRSIERGTFGQRGKHPKPLRSLEEFEASLEQRKIWEKEWRSKYSKNKPQKKLLWAAKRRAAAKNLPFDLIESDIHIPEKCPYLNIPLELHASRGTPRGAVCSLDRIIPEKGYVKTNVEVISQLANTMKQNASPEQLISFAKEILRRYDCSL